MVSINLSSVSDCLYALETNEQLNTTMLKHMNIIVVVVNLMCVVYENLSHTVVIVVVVDSLEVVRELYTESNLY